MEAAAQEVALFSNVEETRTEKPSGYPEDQTTEENKFVATLNAKAGGTKIGPSLVLRVMAGDTVQINARAFYKSQGPADNNSKAPVEDMIAGLVQAFGGNAGENGSHASEAIANNTPFNADFYNNNYQRLKEKNEENGQSDRPKAYLNFVLFDDDFKLVEDNSGVRQVKSSPDELQELGVEKMAIEESGFLYVYTSNESQQDVFFDNVVLGVTSGPLLEETHYYPYGLTMAGIGSKTFGGIENRYKYNGKELQNNEFTDASGLELYDFGARLQDPQLGRWWQEDPLSEKRYWVTPYNYVQNNPIVRIDPNGLTDYTVNKRTGEVKQIGEKNNNPDRILKSKGKDAQVKYDKRTGQAKVAADGIEQGILKDGMNLKMKNNLIEVGGKGQATQKGVEAFAVKLSEYLGVEVGGSYYSKDGSSNTTHVAIGKYLNNTSTKTLFFGNTSADNLTGVFHTHPSNGYSALDRMRPSDADLEDRDNNLLLRPGLKHYILTGSSDWQSDFEKEDYTKGFEKQTR